MEKYLPEVQRQTAASMSANMASALDDKQFLKMELKKIKNVNPVIAEFMRNYSKATKNQMQTMYCGLMVYKLLYSQAEADKMNEQDGF
jgi:hypothetical protein